MELTWKEYLALGGCIVLIIFVLSYFEYKELESDNQVKIEQAKAHNIQQDQK